MRIPLSIIGPQRSWLACVLLLSPFLGVPPRAMAQASVSHSSANGVSLPPRLRAAVDRLADSARTLGLPYQPLYLKAAEGVLKGASEERVTVVVSRLLAELSEARQALGTEATSAELVAGASAVHAGVDAAMLRRIHAARASAPSGNSLVMALVVLADLVARHVTPEIATTSVSALAERAAPDLDFADLRSDVEREVERGQPPDVVTRARTTAILRRLPADERRSAPQRPLDPTLRP
jgi:hypothetical protein